MYNIKKQFTFGKNFPIKSAKNLSLNYRFIFKWYYFSFKEIVIYAINSLCNKTDRP